MVGIQPSLKDSEEYDAYSSLFDFSRVKNNWVKITLGEVKNIGISHPKLHSPVPVHLPKSWVVTLSVFPA